jgi:hypothetical protein
MLMSPWVDLAEGTHPMIPFRNSWERNGPIDFPPQDLAIIFAEASVNAPPHAGGCLRVIYLIDDYVCLIASCGLILWFRAGSLQEVAP